MGQADLLTNISRNLVSVNFGLLKIIIRKTIKVKRDVQAKDQWSKNWILIVVINSGEIVSPLHSS